MVASDYRQEHRRTKAKYAKHRRGTKPLTVWVEEDYKEELRAEAQEAAEYLPGWNLSSHVRFLLDKQRGKWNKKYIPIQYKEDKKR